MSDAITAATLSPVPSLKAHLRGTTKLTDPDPLKADFRNFLWVIWKHLNLPDPTPVQYDIAQFLQHGPRRLVIEAFRGVGKSWVTSAFVLWLLYVDPQTKVLVVSASKERADAFSTFTLRLINEVELLQHLRPRDEQRSSKVAFDVGPAQPDHAPSVKSVGINGQIAGSRANVIVADDIEVPNNSATQPLRDKLLEAVKEFDAVLKPGGRVVYLGTPQSEQSVYNALPDRGYTVRIWPSRYPKPDKREKYGAKLAPFIATKLDANPDLAGAPTDIARFDDEDLMERELSYGRSGYALQFQLDTSLSDADKYPLRLSDLIVLPVDPLMGPSSLAWGSGPQQRTELPAVGLPGDHYYAPVFVSQDYLAWEGVVMFVDPSGKGKDETAWIVLRQLHGKLFLTKLGARQDGYSDDTLSAILKDAKSEGVNLILVEPNAGLGMFAQLLRAKAMEMYPVTIEDAEWASVQKEVRIIDTLEPIMNQHRLIVTPEVIEYDYRSTTEKTSEDVNRYRLFYQMTRITRERNALVRDDRLDALAGAVAYWIESMGRNAEQDHLAQKEQALDDELEKFMDSVLGGQRQQSRSYASQIMRTK